MGSSEDYNPPQTSTVIQQLKLANKFALKGVLLKKLFFHNADAIILQSRDFPEKTCGKNDDVSLLPNLYSITRSQTFLFVLLFLF